MEEEIKYELEDLKSIADGAVPPELSKNEAINIINFIENLIKRNKELEENYDKLSKHFIENHIPKSKVREKIEWLKTISDNGANAVRFAMTYEDEIERKQKQKDINTMISILEELQEGDDK